MKRQVVWANFTRDDYLAILRYIAQSDPDAALRVADRIDAAADALAEFATGRAGRVTGTYEKVLPSLSYIMVYEIVTRPEGGETIAILHVIHGARHWPEESWPED